MFWRFLQRKTESTKFIAEIDGLRFFAIITVIFYHLNTTLSRHLDLHGANPLGGSSTIDSLGWWFVRLDLGVKVFFAISGFILALPFIKAFKQRRNINLKSYFYKRLTRLEPPYLLTLIGLFIVHVFYLNESIPDFSVHLLTGLFYCNGLVFGAPNPINPVTWSLEVEAQFYIIVPILFLALKLSKFYYRIIFYVLLFVIAAYLKHTVFMAQIFYLMYSLVGFLLNFICGVLFAIFFTEWPDFFRRKKQLVWDFLGVIFIFLMFTFYKPQSNYTNIAIFNVSILGLFFSTFLGKAFNWIFTRPLIYIIGGMCYSIYLLHYALFHFIIKITGRIYITEASYASNLILQAILMIPIMLIISGAFFLLIEKPCMDRNWPSKLANWLKVNLFQRES